MITHLFHHLILALLNPGKRSSTFLRNVGENFAASPAPNLPDVNRCSACRRTYQDAVSSLRSFMTLHTVVTRVPVKKEFVSLSYRRFHIPEDILLKSLRLCVHVFACNNSRNAKWIFVKCDVGAYYGVRISSVMLYVFMRVNKSWEERHSYFMLITFLP